MQKLRGLAKRGVEMGYKALLASHPRVMKTGRGTFLRVIRQICIVVMLIGLSCDKPAATRPATGPASAPTVKRVHVFISGKVQGVGFRAFTKERADELGVKGWVKNLLDGRVEAVMQGPSDSIEKLLATVRKGPRSSRVEGVEVKDEKIAEEFHDFRVIEGQ